MNRESILNEIYSLVLENGIYTEKIDVLEEDNRVYTKKIPVDGITIYNGKTKFVSVSGYKKDLSDTSCNDLRINMQDYNGNFLNAYADLFTTDDLENILTFLKNNV